MLYFLALLSTIIAMGKSAAIVDDELICTCTDVLCRELGHCALGEVKDICGCCNECARDNGEPCGGIYNHAGICGIGLRCQPNDFRQLPGTCVSDK
uniref:Putative salivary secreted protein n=1 Tax=Megacormus gertschi TaxID=1843536 RepID=A0A224XG67_9SCOR